MKVSSNSNTPKQLKCVFCYPIAPLAKLKRCIVNYKSTNGIFAFQKYLKTNHVDWTKERLSQKKGEL
jgi:hypothetical protein